MKRDSLEMLQPIAVPAPQPESGPSTVYALVESLLNVADRVGKTGFRAAQTTELVGSQVGEIHAVLKQQVESREADLREERRRIGELQDRERRMLAALCDISDLVVAAASAAERELGPEGAAHLEKLRREVAKVADRCGLEPTATPGDRIDPELHELIDQVATEGAPRGQILEVVRQGYRFNGVAIRPARVVVSD